METIRNYLETMFRNMPNTPEVRRAKDELGQMMEDKYSELIAEGLSENAAVGTVISEFGNLDEISEVLGISHFLPARVENTQRAGRMLSMDEIRDYLHDDRKAGLILSVGVFACIVSVCGPILMDTIGNYMGGSSFFDAVGVMILFLLVMAGVAAFIIAGRMRAKWAHIRKEPCSIDYSTAQYLTEMVRTDEQRFSAVRIVGVLLCIASIVPVIILSNISVLSRLFETIGSCLLFVIAGIGVLLIIFSVQYQSAAKELLRKNSGDTVGGNFTRTQTEIREGAEKSGFLSVYWPTVTCVYLCVSFLTFEWGITWLIWPIAGVLYGILVLAARRARRNGGM